MEISETIRSISERIQNAAEVPMGSGGGGGGGVDVSPVWMIEITPTARLATSPSKTAGG